MVASDAGESTKSRTSSSLLLTKGLRLLRQVANQGECGVRELARQTGLSSTVVHRLVTSLLDEGFLERNDQNGRYRVGAQAFEVGRAFLKSARIETCAPPVMQDIVDRGEFNAFLGVMRGSMVVYLSAMQDNGPITIRMVPGSEAPLHTTAMGKVLLAELPDEEILQKIEFYRRSRADAAPSVDTAALLREINEVRTTGFACSEGEAFHGIVAVGVPIRDFSRRVVAALSLAMPSTSLTAASRERLIATARDAGVRISFGLGDREG